MSKNPEILTQEELQKIKERADKAKAGPWISYIEGRDHMSGSNFIMTGIGEARGEDIELFGATVEDQDFIAHARQDIPKLLKEIEYLNSKQAWGE